MPEIRPAEEVALTALPGHSDAQRYYKVQGNKVRRKEKSRQTKAEMARPGERRYGQKPDDY